MITDLQKEESCLMELEQQKKINKQEEIINKKHEE